MPSEKDKKFKARTFKVHLTKIRKYLDKDSKVVPVDPRHLGQFEPAMEEALIEHADSYVSDLMEPQPSTPPGDSPSLVDGGSSMDAIGANVEWQAPEVLADSVAWSDDDEVELVD